MKTFRDLLQEVYADNMATEALNNKAIIALADELDRRSLETMQISAVNDQYRRFRIESHKAKTGDD